jgi:hypothetical protein
MLDDDYKFSKMEDSISKIIHVASDMSRMIAVHEQRLTQQEKLFDNVANVFENRRKEIDYKIEQVYVNYMNADEKVIAELKTNRSISAVQYEDQNKKIEGLQKMIWTASGAMTAIGLIISLAINFLKLIH